MEIKQITVSGSQGTNKVYPVHFGLNAIRTFCNEKKIELNDFANLISKMSDDGAGIKTIETMADLTLAAIRDGLRKTRQPERISEIAFEDIIDLFEESPDEINNMFETISGALSDEAPGASEKNAYSRNTTKPR